MVIADYLSFTSIPPSCLASQFFASPIKQVANEWICEKKFLLMPLFCSNFRNSVIFEILYFYLRYEIHGFQAYVISFLLHKVEKILHRNKEIVKFAKIILKTYPL